MNGQPNILICDDDPVVHESLALYLDNDNFTHTDAYDGRQGLEMAQTGNADLILLDVMMPEMSGLDVCREVRKTLSTPIIILTAKGEEIDRVLGLELGADDYMEKPFDSKELVARVRAVLRRCSQSSTPAPTSDTKVVEYPDLVISLNDYSVMYNGQYLDMPPKEIELLFFLASQPNQVFTREQLLDHIWGYEYAGDTRTVDVHIKRLREKINDHKEWRLHTVWGVGYKFEARSV